MDSQEQRLQQEIIADARKKAERIRAKALTEKEKLLQKFRQELAVRREERLAEVEAETTQQARNIRNGLSMEKRKRWLRRREESIQTFLAETLALAGQCSGSEREKSLTLLTEEALAALPPGEYQVRFAPRDAALVTLDWLKQRCRNDPGGAAAAGFCFELQPDAGLEGGILLTAKDQSRWFDNTYSARMNLLGDPLRSQLARQTAGPGQDA